MKLTYNNLWKLLIDKNMNKIDLSNASGLSSSSIAKLTKGENVNTDTLVKICKALKCDIKDIVAIVPNEQEEKNDD
ncbi:helix-turn-helix domain-containing protein [Facklamia languida]